MDDLDKIKLIVLDVDGVLTDGKIFFDTNGCEYKSFHVKDGMGINLARYYGMKIALITGRKSKTVQLRAKELNIDYLFEGIKNKIEVVNEIVTKLNIGLKNVFYMGDDINDLPVIRLVGLSAAPNDASEIIKKSVHFVSKSDGGNGSVREAIDYVLSKQTDYNNLIEKYIYENITLIKY